MAWQTGWLTCSPYQLYLYQMVSPLNLFPSKHILGNDLHQPFLSGVDGLFVDCCFVCYCYFCCIQF